jgi:hypothetical protein
MHLGSDCLGTPNKTIFDCRSTVTGWPLLRLGSGPLRASSDVRTVVLWYFFFYRNAPRRTIGRAATAHGQRPCWGWVREGCPSRNGGSGGVTPGSFYLFFSAVDEFWCILKTENKIILKGFDSSKNTIKSHIATSDDLNTVYS